MRAHSAGSFLAAVAGPLVLLVPPGPPVQRPPVAPTATVAPTGGLGEEPARWRWPLSPAPPPVLRPFAAPRGPYGPGHRGADLAAAAGTPVLAVEAGVVAHAGRVAGRGTVTVRHRGGLSSTYEPVRPAVTAGRAVGAGDVVGVLETSSRGHCGPSPCLHLGARRGRTYLDPLLLLAGGRVRLLPLGPAQSSTG